jgi:tetratricopeptide (TPR) repeat protein
VLGVLALQYVRGLDPRFLPRSPASLRAFAHYLAGDYGEAARHYRADLVGRVPPDAPPWWIAYLAGDLPAAEKHVQRDLDQDPKNVDALTTLAEVALARQRYEEVLDLGAKVLALRTDDYDALLLAAVAHARRGSAGPAIAALNQALRHSRTERRGTVFLAALELTGDLDDGSPSSPCLLAHLHRYLRIFDESHARLAERYARQAIASGDRVDDAYVTLGVIFEKTGRRRYALDAFRSGVAANPRNVHALRGAARQHSRRGDIAEEYRLLKQSYEAAPHDAFVVNGFHGFLTGKLGDYPQALALDRAAVATNPSDDQAWWRLGTVQSYLGDHQAALAAHRRAASLAPGNPEFHDHIAYQLLHLGRLQEAEVTYQHSIGLDSRRGAPRAGLATIHARHERWAEARREYERAYWLGARDVETVVNLCQVYQALLDNRRALTCLTEVLTRDPDNVRARQLLEHVRGALAVKS